MKYTLVIDSLIDGVTGVQSNATQSVESLIVGLVRTQYPQFEVRPFSSENVAKSPLVLIGTFTGVNDQGKPTGTLEAFRICFALLDLQSGKIISWSRNFAKTKGVPSPSPAKAGLPDWGSDPLALPHLTQRTE